MTIGGTALLSERLRRLATMPAVVWDRYQMRKDPVWAKLSPEQVQSIPVQAAKAAASAQRLLYDSYGAMSPSNFAERLHIAVHEERPSRLERPPFLSLAKRQPPEIIVAPQAFEIIAEQVERYQLHSLCGTVSQWREAAIAHELFHHIEWRAPSLTSSVKKVTTFRLGPLRLRGLPMSAEEIAAMHFAQLLTNCPVRPDFLEILYLAGTDRHFAWTWLERLEAWAGPALRSTAKA